jgi:DNA polymerase III epsilon subunit-like protein
MDVETCGLPFTAGFASFYPPHKVGYYTDARIIEIASVEYNDDGEEVSSIATRVSPSGIWTMNPTSQRIHGIHTKDLRMGTAGVTGTREAMVLLFEQLQSAFARTAHDIPVMVGHNVNFDWHVIAAEAYGARHFALFDMLCTIGWHCTMHTTTKLCGLLRPNGLAKWPTLGELYRHLFGEEPPDAHSAIGDVRSTARCFFQLRRGKWEPDGR